MGEVLLDNLSISKSTRQLLANSLVWDGHGCMPLRAKDEKFLPQLARYKNAGVDVVSLNVGFDVVPWQNTILVLSHFRHWIKRHADKYLLIEHTEDIQRARKEDKLGVMFDLEGGCSLNEHLSMVELYYDLGVRWMLFAYNRNNPLGGGCEDDDQGLTDFGRQVLDEMARVGMVTCCSHVGHRTAMEIIELAQNPVIFSHSNPKGMWEHARNVKDEAIKACAETGGIVAVSGIGNFLGENDGRTETIVRHIDYVTQLVGPEHVGLGLDYVFDKEELDNYLKQNPKTFPPREYLCGLRMVRPEQIPEIADGLIDMGYSEQDIHYIFGENQLRVAKQVWK